MGKGFGRRYWIQLIGKDGNEQWVPWANCQQSAVLAAGVKVQANPNLDYALILDGKVPEGAIPSVKQILAEVNVGGDRPGKRLRLPGVAR